jgi:alpha-2-macroglobulin
VSLPETDFFFAATFPPLSFSVYCMKNTPPFQKVAWFLSNSLIFSFLLLLSGCGKGDKVEVVNRNFDDQINLQQNLIFTFNRDLVDKSKLDLWDSTAYIRFEPAVKGKFRWTGTDELVFSPDASFTPATDYKAILDPELLKNNPDTKPKLSLSAERSFAFHTPYLSVEKADVYWTKSESGTPQIRYQLAFNYKVNPAEVANLTTVETNGKSLTFKPVGNQLSELVQFATDASDEMSNQVTQINIKEGLKTETGKITKQAIKTSAQIPPRDPFQILNINTEYEGETGICYVHTNQTPSGDDLKNLISTDPATDFEVEKQDYGFIIRSNAFKPGSYSLTFSNQMRGIFGSKLENDYSQVVAFGEMNPFVRFTSDKGFYLAGKGSKEIGVQLVGLEKVRITIYKIYENNVLAFLRQGGYIDDYGNYGEDGEFVTYADNPFGDIVSQKEVNVRDLHKVGGIYYLNMGLKDNNDFKGMYAVKVSSTTENWVNASKLMSVSDLGMIIKQTEDEVYAFVNSLLTAEPVSGVTVNLVSSNNQTLYTAQTDGKGVAHFVEITKKAPKFKVAMVSALKDKDFNFVYFEQNRIENARYDVGGSRENAAGQQAFLYGDRNLYRPGETMYLNAVIRDGKWKTVGEMPVKIKITAPNGKEFTTLKATLNKQSAFSTQVEFPVSALTGNYNAEVFTANDILLASRAVSVEEFMPDRIKVEVKVAKPVFRSGENASMTATATNLFGPPAANRNYEITATLARKDFTSPDFEDYNFSVQSQNNPALSSFVRSGTTDRNGRFQESLTIPATYQDLGLLEGSFYTTVFDESGRPVNRLNRFEVQTQDIFYGIKRFDGYVNTGEPLQMVLLAVGKDGKAQSGTAASVQIVKHNYETVLQKDRYGSVNYVSQRKDQVMDAKTLTINASGTAYAFIPQLSGEYEIMVTRPGNTTSYVSQSFYAYGFGVTNNAFEVDKDGQITIEADQKKYKPGDKAKLLLKTPFAGKLLITVERNKVFEHFYVNTDKKSASVEISVQNEHVPNVYVSATLIRPLGDGALPLTVAHGYASLPVENADYQMPVEITAPAQSRSRTQQTFTVKTKPNAEVTVAVVDEGILLVKNFESPDPYQYFFQKRALEVQGYDIYPRLFPEMKSFSGSGGDMEAAAMSGRLNPMANKRVKLVSFWSGTLTANASGIATYIIEVPQFSGDLRIMAVAYRDNAFGSAAKNMKVADPVVIASALPRFLSPGDNLQMPVTLSNTTNQPAQAQVSLKLSGGLSPEGSVNQTVTIPANAEVQVPFSLKAAQTVGTGSVEILVKALNATFTDKTDITIRPIQSLLKTSGSGAVAGGKTENFMVAGNFIPTSTQAKLVLSRSPVAELSGNLNYLLEYPYGCVEQTTSTAFPQIYFAELSQSLMKTRKPTYVQVASQPMKQGAAAYNVQQAINKLSAMQLASGGLSYWAEGGKESWWGTVYAAHFMIEAQRAGFSVNRQVLKKMLEYLRTMARNQKNQEQYFFYDENGVRRERRIAPKETAYSLFVLALNGKSDVSTMNYYKSRKEMLALDSRYLLASAYLLGGDNGSYRALLPDAFAGEKSEKVFGGSFYSYLRDEGVALNALLDTDPQNPQIPVMAKHLSEALRKTRYPSTQEAAFALLAFGKLAKQTNKSLSTAQVTVGGKTIANFKGEDLVLTSDIANTTVVLKTGGNGNLYYFWQASGLTTSNEVKEEDNFLKVRKSFYDRNGRRLQGNTFYQNDLVVVKLEVATTDGSSVENTVITDMLPAGFEIENPRITDLPEMSWAKANATYPEHLDIRDDRIHFFTTATGRVSTFYYLVRAVSQGNFRMGPASADAMYNGEYHSLSGSGQIRVLDRNAEPEPTSNVGVKPDSMGNE